MLRIYTGMQNCFVRESDMAAIADQLGPFSMPCFGCDLSSKQPYQGTLFRFPLRTEQQAARYGAGRGIAGAYPMERVRQQFETIQIPAVNDSELAFAIVSVPASANATHDDAAFFPVVDPVHEFDSVHAEIVLGFESEHGLQVLGQIGIASGFGHRDSRRLVEQRPDDVADGIAIANSPTVSQLDVVATSR